MRAQKCSPHCVKTITPSLHVTNETQFRSRIYHNSRRRNGTKANKITWKSTKRNRLSGFCPPRQIYYPHQRQGKKSIMAVFNRSIVFLNRRWPRAKTNVHKRVPETVEIFPILPRLLFPTVFLSRHATLTIPSIDFSRQTLERRQMPHGSLLVNFFFFTRHSTEKVTTTSTLCYPLVSLPFSFPQSSFPFAVFLLASFCRGYFFAPFHEPRTVAFSFQISVNRRITRRSELLDCARPRLHCFYLREKRKIIVLSW